MAVFKLTKLYETGLKSLNPLDKIVYAIGESIQDAVLRATKIGQYDIDDFVFEQFPNSLIRLILLRNEVHVKVFVFKYSEFKRNKKYKYEAFSISDGNLIFKLANPICSNSKKKFLKKIKELLIPKFKLHAENIYAELNHNKNEFDSGLFMIQFYPNQEPIPYWFD